MNLAAVTLPILDCKTGSARGRLILSTAFFDALILYSLGDVIFFDTMSKSSDSDLTKGEHPAIGLPK